MPCNCQSNNNGYDNKIIWGPILWNFLHAIPEMFKRIEKLPVILKNINNFYLILPCEECQMHSKEYFTSNKLTISNENDIITSKKEIKIYLFNFHNAVNLRLNKPVLESFDEYINNNNSVIFLKNIKFSDIYRTVKYNEINKKFFEEKLDEEQKKIVEQILMNNIH
jgi:hypothetical protein